jgi:hypothetical protein
METLNWHNEHTAQRVCVPQLPNPKSSGCSGPLAAPPLASNPGILQGLDPQKLPTELQRRVSLLQALQHQARLPSLPGQVPAFLTPAATQPHPAVSASLNISAGPSQLRCGPSHPAVNASATAAPSRAVQNISASLRGALGCRAPQLTPAETAAGMAHVLHQRSRSSFLQAQRAGRSGATEASDLSKLQCSLHAGMFLLPLCAMAKVGVFTHRPACTCTTRATKTVLVVELRQ